MMYETFGALDEINQNIVKALKKAEEDGYITTKTISDILKPVKLPIDFIISESTWWSYEELLDNIRIISEPGHIFVSFPKYHIGELVDDTLSSKEETSFDAVSHPSHYAEGRKYEPRKVIADWGLNFNLGNAVKYISRAGRKGDKIEDLQKAIQYIEFELEELDPNYMSSESRIMRLKNRLNVIYSVYGIQNGGKKS